MPPTKSPSYDYNLVVPNEVEDRTFLDKEWKIQPAGVQGYMAILTTIAIQIGA